MEVSERKINILIIEGIALFFVMFVHSGTPNFIYTPFSYGIAAFIFARGYQWRDRGFQQFLSSRVRLLTTYYWAGAINTALFLVIVPSRFLPAPKLEYLKNFLLVRLDRLDRIPITIVPTWFLTMLFFAELYYFFLKKRKLLLYTSVVFSVLLRLIPHEPWPFKLDSALLAIPFFHVGEVWKEKQLQVDVFGFVLSIFGLILISLTNGDISWNAMAFGRNGIIASLGELLTIPILVYLSLLVKGKKFEQVFTKLALNALFVLSYHFLLGAVLALPFVVITGNYEQPVAVLHKVWFLHFPIVLALVFLLINKVPRKVLAFLVGDLMVFSTVKSKTQFRG